MDALTVNRRALAWGAGLLATGFGAEAAVADDAMGIVHGGDAIRQTVGFKASPARVYRALTDAKVFDKVVRASDAFRMIGKMMAKSPTRITANPGAGFSLFGGYISGRNIELKSDVLIIQAWRSASWAVNDYSIARFALAGDGAGTRLTLDHRGFPDGEAQHLAEGWHDNYWTPLAKVLA